MARIPSAVAVRLANVGEEIRQRPPIGPEFHAYTARILVMANLPHRDPGDLPFWRRENGWFTLTIHPASDKKGRRLYPWGSIPRLILYWLVTEAVRTGSRRLELGTSLAGFMRRIGLKPETGGGKRGDARRLGNQIHRLFTAQIRMVDGSEDMPFQSRRVTMTIAEVSELWWTGSHPDQQDLFCSYVILGDAFYQAITAHAFPVDRRALEVLKQSPLALDLYAWLSYRAFALGGRAQTISWESLRRQIGSAYSDQDNFGKAARKALQKIKAVYPGLAFDFPKGRLRILPSKPAVPWKKPGKTQIAHGETVPGGTVKWYRNLYHLL